VVEVTNEVVRKELALVGRSGITLKMVVERLLDPARRASPQPSKAYVPLVAQLLGDFTPEMAFASCAMASGLNREAGCYLFWAALYLAAHSSGVQRRDAARLLALMALAVAEDPQTARQFYRWNVLEPSAAAADEMAQLDVLVREQLARMQSVLPGLIAEQEPVDEVGRERARRLILSQFTGPPPEPIHSKPGGNARRSASGQVGCGAHLLTAFVLSGFIGYLAWELI
jgi:hypothetical protein